MEKLSEQLFQQACDLLVGGVNSPVRAFKAVGGTPPFIRRAAGAYLWDEDGNRYIDYVGSWGTAILGHAPPAVVAAITEAAADGTSFGAPTAWEIRLATLIREAIPSLERIRFVNSGTEATMGAIRLARGFAQRDKILKFAGCYHGHADHLLVKAGSGALTMGEPDSAGVPADFARHTLVSPYNDLISVGHLFERYPQDIAAVIVEPVAGNMGCILPVSGFLEGLRTLCDQYGTILIFDEVMTGFRVARGGAQGLYNVRPDLTCLGKVIGGGLPVGAYGGRREVMEQLSPLGPVYQAGTLSGNPLAMAAGIATLTALGKPGFYDRLGQLSKAVARGFQAACHEADIPCQTTHVGGMWGYFLHDRPVLALDDLRSMDRERFRQFFHGMLEHGMYLAPSPFEAAFVSAAHTEADIAATVEAVRQVVSH